MRVGIIVPQGWVGEFAGWEPRAAWARSVEIAQAADRLGFESVWLYDHFHTTPEPTDELTFEAFTSLSGLAALTGRVRLGQIVTCASYRNPALLAKMVSTMDTISGGRMELGLGAGWKREEWEAYGYEFPATRERLAILEDTLEIVRRMFEPGRASYDGAHGRVDGAINLPKPLQQPRVPIMVGGNGREVTWRIAARLADEINTDSMPPDELRDEAMPIIRERCEEIGRDPATLRVSSHIWWQHLDAAPNRAAHLRAYADAGASRVMTMIRASVADVDELDRFREDCVEAGVELADVEDSSSSPSPSEAASVSAPGSLAASRARARTNRGTPVPAR